MYFLTMQNDGDRRRGSRVRLGGRGPDGLRPWRADRAGQDQAAADRHRAAGSASSWRRAGRILLETTLGRALFNEALPADYPYADYEVGKKQLGQIVNDLAERYPKVEVAHTAWTP